MPKYLTDNDSTKISLLLYGDPGAGKSIFAASSRKYKTAIVDTENGLLSVQKYCKANGIDLSNRPVFEVKDSKTFTSAMRDIGKLVTSKEVELVCFDTASAFQKLLISGYLRESGDTKLAFHSGNEKGWNDVLNIMRSVSDSFATLDCHWVWLAHEKIIKVAGQDKAIPNFQGAFNSDIAQPFSEIARATTKVTRKFVSGKPQNIVERTLWFAPSPLYLSKDRSMNLPEEFETDKGIDYLFDLIQNGEAKTGAIVAPEQFSQED